VSIKELVALMEKAFKLKRGALASRKVGRGPRVKLELQARAMSRARELGLGGHSSGIGGPAGQGEPCLPVDRVDLRVWGVSRTLCCRCQAFIKDIALEFAEAKPGAVEAEGAAEGAEAVPIPEAAEEPAAKKAKTEVGVGRCSLLPARAAIRHCVCERENPRDQALCGAAWSSWRRACTWWGVG
jgi:hypothetical protein